MECVCVWCNLKVYSLYNKKEKKQVIKQEDKNLETLLVFMCVIGDYWEKTELFNLTLIICTMTGSSDWTLLDRPSNTTIISHTSTILHGLNELRRLEYLIDVTLLAEGQSFKVKYL